MNSLWERLSVCKEKIKELEAKLDSVTKEIQQLNDEISYNSVCSARKEWPKRSLLSEPIDEAYSLYGEA